MRRRSRRFLLRGIRRGGLSDRDGLNLIYGRRLRRICRRHAAGYRMIHRMMIYHLEVQDEQEI